MLQTPDWYVNKQDNMVGFYVVASDKELLAKVHTVMKKRGYLELADTSGNLNYIIDGRRNKYNTTNTIDKLSAYLMEESQPYSVVAGEEDPVVEASMKVLDKWKFDNKLKGTKILRYILPLAVHNEHKVSPLCKFLYPKAAEYFGMSQQQIDRVLRYTAKKAKIEMGNSALLHKLLDETKDLIQKSK